MKNPNYPSLYQINTRVWLTELSGESGRRATLDDIPDSAPDQFAKMGFEDTWFLSVWSTGEAAKKISRENTDWQSEFKDTLPDLRVEDIAGSGFAIHQEISTQTGAWSLDFSQLLTFRSTPAARRRLASAGLNKK